jgi:hypothetical protein
LWNINMQCIMYTISVTVSGIKHNCSDSPCTHPEMHDSE